MRAAICARVSSALQRERDTIASQLRTLPEFVAQQGWDLVDTFIDDGQSAKAGNLENRTGLRAMLAAAAAGRFDVLVVVDIDRLTRSEDLIERAAILGALQRAGVKIASAAKGQVLDLSTSSGDLMVTLDAFFAAEWSRKHRERIVQGKLTAIQRGRKPSGPTPYGLAYSRETGVWTVDPVKGPIVREMFERVAAGETCMSIADDLHVRRVPRPRGSWHYSRVVAIVRSRHPVGEWHVDKRRKLVLEVPPIVTEELWQRADAMLRAHGKRGLKKTKHTYLLEGLGHCSECGSPMLIRTSIRLQTGTMTTPAYVCRRRKLILRDEPRCSAAIVPTADADDRVWAKIAEQLDRSALVDMLNEERARVAADRRDWQSDAAGYRKHLERLVKAEGAILRRVSREEISEEAADAELAVIRRERRAYKRQLEAAEKGQGAAVAAQERLHDVGETVRRLRAKAAIATQSERRELVQALLGPDGARFVGREVRFSILLPLEEPARAPIALVDAAVYSPSAENYLRIPLAA